MKTRPCLAKRKMYRAYGKSAERTKESRRQLLPVKGGWKGSARVRWSENAFFCARKCFSVHCVCWARRFHYGSITQIRKLSLSISLVPSQIFSTFLKNGPLEEHLLENCWSVVLAVSQCLHAGRENRTEGTKTWETNSMNLSILGKSAGHRIF